MCPIDDYLPSSVQHIDSVVQRFRAGKYSAIVRKIRKTMSESLRGEQFNGRITDYFIHQVDERYPIRFTHIAQEANLLPINPPVPTLIKKGDSYFFYGNTDGSNWKYTPLDASIVTAVLENAGIALEVDSTLYPDARFEDIYEEILIKVAHTSRVSEPFINFSQDPLQVGEFKKTINALYYLELVFIEIENNGYSGLLHYSKLRQNAFKASQLLNSGIGVANAFSGEITEAIRLLTELHQLTEQGAQKVRRLGNTDTEGQQTSLSYKAGFASGVAVDQMQPGARGHLDYDYLTNFTAVLPGYIDQLTQAITKYTNSTTMNEGLNEQKIIELKKEGLQLLNAIEKAQEGGSFGTLQLLNYIHLVRHIVNLSTDILSQTDILNEASQDYIRERLAYLKYDVFPRLMVLTDKIEIEFMLQPGSLSNPLISKLNPLYDFLIQYAKNPVNFDAKGEYLLKLEDKDFMDLRTSAIYHQKDESENEIYRIERAHHGLTEFFTYLSDPRYKNMRLCDLPYLDKQVLIEHLKSFEQYIAKSDTQLHQLIITGLTVDDSSWLKPVNFGLSMLSSMVRTDDNLISEILPRLFTPIEEIDVITENRSQEAIKTFCMILTDERYEQLRLDQLPDDVKLRLINQFNLFRPSLEQSDIRFYQMLTDGLTKTQSTSSWLYDQTIGRPAHILYSDERLVPQIVAKLQSPQPQLMRTLNQLHQSQQLQIQLYSDVIEAITSSNALVLFPYHRKQNIFKIDEKSALPQSALADTHLEFSDDPNHSTVTNPDNLTLKDTQILRKWYKNKLTDLENARNARTDLLSILSANFRGNEQIIFGAHQEALKATCRQLYNHIQPYMIGASADNISQFDKAVVQLFCGRFGDLPSRTYKKITPEDFYRLLSPNFLTTLDATKSDLERQEHFYTARYEELYTDSLISKKLSAEISSAERARYLLKHTESSKHLSILRKTVQKWSTALLDDSIVSKLNRAPEGTPYPELEDLRKTLSESSQVLAFKRVANFLYYAEMLLLELEKINEDDLLEVKAKQILAAVGHASELFSLGSDLLGDPFYSMIYQDVTSKLSNVKISLLDNINPYTTGFNEIAPLDEKPAKYTGLWYILEALALLPDHIDSLTGKSHLASIEQKAHNEKIQKSTKQVDIKIERIMEHLDSSYLRLLLDLPQARPLYDELLRQIKSFTKTTNESVLNHIDDINTELFANLLIELDLWEHKIGLKPGTLATPMQEILDEYYRGLVSPLDFSFQEETRLLCSLDPIKKRHEVELARFNDALIQYHDLTPNILALEELIALVNQSSTDHGTLLANYQYANAIPLIDAFQTYCLEKKIQLPMTIDNLSTFVRPTNSKQLNDFKNLLYLCKSYYEGLREPSQLSMDMSAFKLNYFEELKTKKISENKQYRIKYANDYFERKLDMYTTRTLGLLHKQTEYNSKLKLYLLSLKEELLRDVSLSQEIDVDLDRLLKEKTALFENAHIKHYYQLDQVMEAIHQFKVYLCTATEANRPSNSPLENEMLDKKNNLITALELISRDDKLDAKARFDEIKKQVRDRGSILANYYHSTTYDLKWLKQRLVALFVSLHLYTTDRQAAFNKIKESINTAPNLLVIKERFNLVLDEPVAQVAVREEAPLEVIENPELPAYSIRNFFLMTPEQIRSLAQQTHLNRAQTDALMVNLDESLFRISAIFREAPAIEHLHTFLSQPKIYTLYRALEGKFDVFGGDNKQEAVTQLARLNNLVFTKLLLEADVWEEEQDLLPGTLTDPLKRAMDDFFQTMVNSLQFDFATKEKLTLSPNQTKNRNNMKLSRLDQRLIPAASFESKRLKLHQYLVLAQKYEVLNDDQFSAPKDYIISLKRELTLAHNACAPIVHEFLSNEGQMDVFPEVIYEEMDNHYDVSSTFHEKILRTLHACKDHYECLSVTAKRSTIILKDGLVHLNLLQRQQHEEKIRLRDIHGRRYFDEQLGEIIQRDIGMAHCSTAYKAELREYLQGHKNFILNQSIKHNKLEVKIKSLLLKHTKKYETEHIAHYQQLDSIMVSLMALKSYFERTDVNDVDNAEYIQELIDIAENTDLLANDRCLEIKALVHDEGEQRFLNHINNERGYKYLVQCVCNLLESLHLFTPTKRKHYKALASALEKPVNMSELTTRFGLFYDPRKPTDAPDVDNEPEDNPEP